MRTKRSSFPVTEIGVEWTELRQREESKVKSLYDAWKMGKDLLKLRLNVNREKHFATEK